MDALDLVAKIKMDMTEYEKGLDDAKTMAESGGSSIGSAFGKLASGGVKILTASIGAAATGVAALTTKAVQSYSEYEQLVGGVQTLFGTQGMSLEQYAQAVGDTVENVKADYQSLEDAQDLVMKNAAEAYKTAGLSANEYMEQATSTAAALVNSLGGDTKEAARLADVAIRDMSDNANKMGTSMESIQNAYNGFAKQNFTMLDNLKLGYGGTKSEMERLLATASEISGIEYDISSYADIVDAIHVVQENMGIMGTTSKEAADTITGSLASAKGAWDNLVTGLAKGEDVTDLMNYFVESIATFAGNIIPIAEKALEGVGTLIQELVPKLMDEIPAMINEVLPKLIESGISVTQAILDGITQNVDTIVSGAVDILLTLANAIIEMLPQFVETGIQVITALINGAAEALPELIPQLVEALLGMLDSLLDNADSLIDAGLNLMEGLFNGLMEALPIVLEALPEIVQKIADFLSKNVNKILQAGKKLLMGIVNAIPTIVSSLASALPQILNTIISTLTQMLPEVISTVVELLPELIQSIVDFFVTSVPELLDAAIQMFMALVDAIPEVIVSLTDALPDIIEAIVGTLTDNIDSILNAAVNMLMAIVDAIPDIIKSLAENLPKIITSIVEALVKAAPDILKAAVEMLGGIISAIADIVTQIPEKMGEIIAAVLEAVGGWFWDLFKDAKKAFDAFGDAIVAAGVAVLDWVKDLPGKIWEKIQEIWEDLKYLGSKIIEGIKDGLLKSDALDNAIKTQVQKAYNAAKESAEVHSPSRLFARIGRFMAEGLGVGWTDEMGELNKQIEKDLDFGEGTVGLNVKKTFETAETVTASTQMKLSDADIDKIVRGLSVTIYNTTEIDGEKIKEDVYTYTVDRMGDETKAIQIAQGGY